ncbi:hypothetical protein D2Q93_15080 [Alicyclobacillaceae bacterium I2511]|nr:hypothetical protein D2Q93_15080 [Alicyclobacillaceae bacterium I2511]
MNHTNTVLKAKTIRTRTIEAKVLQIGPRVFGRIPYKGRLRKIYIPLLHKYHSLQLRFRRLREEVKEVQAFERTLRHDNRHLRDKLNKLEEKVESLKFRVESLESQLSSGLPDNPALQALFIGLQGQSATVTTAAGTLTGVVTVVGVNAVELTEANGDLLVIPYSKVTAVQ